MRIKQADIMAMDYAELTQAQIIFNVRNLFLQNVDVNIHSTDICVYVSAITFADNVGYKCCAFWQRFYIK